MYIGRNSKQSSSGRSKVIQHKNRNVGRNEELPECINVLANINILT